MKLFHPAIATLLLALSTEGAMSSAAQGRAAPDRDVGPAGFDTIRRHADEARTGGRLGEAVELYSRAVRLKPSWAEGHWYLGTIAYQTDNYAACRDAFRTVIRLDTGNGAASAFKGLCEFRLKNFGVALQDLSKAQVLEIGDPELIPVARYHRALLLTRFGHFESAVQVFAGFAREGNASPSLVEALGLAVLRIPILPDDIPPDKRDLVRLAGRATLLASSNRQGEAQEAFAELLRRYPGTPNVHYLYGAYLLHERADEALEEFHKELHVEPNHARAMLQIADELTRRGEFDAARSWATRAVRIEPRSFVGRRILGQIKLEVNDIAGAIVELETAERLEANSPSVHYALARAYQRAGRPEDANRERAEFSRLERIQQEQRGGADAIGGVLK
ncbi:MAG: hypothetical protein V7647_2068 [Acidobacteriota bacterium]|jgi:tetratricopeptide (TPR) repeat protein